VQNIAKSLENTSSHGVKAWCKMEYKRNTM